jgi:hypothetical protein
MLCHAKHASKKPLIAVLEHVIMFISFHRMYLYHCKTNNLLRLTSKVRKANLPSHSLFVSWVYSCRHHCAPLCPFAPTITKINGDLVSVLRRRAKCGSRHLSSIPSNRLSGGTSSHQPGGSHLFFHPHIATRGVASNGSSLASIRVPGPDILVLGWRVANYKLRSVFLA